MRKGFCLLLTAAVGFASLSLATGCENDKKEVTVQGKRGREKTYEVEKDRHGNVTNVERTK